MDQPLPDALLATKLTYPPLRSELVARPRLVARLAPESLPPLTLVCAPAGYGKTTLVAAALAAAGPASAGEPAVAWLSLDEEDNDPVRFWRYVIAALDRGAAGLGSQVLALLQSPQSPPLPAILTFLVNDLVALGQCLILVLDDYHTIHNNQVHEGLAFVLEHQPEPLRLVLTSRNDPPLPLARLRARGQLGELRADDLRFTAGEAADFLAEVMGLPLTAGQVEALEARTEGWIAGLQLAALSLQGQADPAAFIDAFSGNHRHLVDYLTEEVLAGQPRPVQAFLLQTAGLDRFCVALCEAVVDADGGAGRVQTILDHLARANLFLVALDLSGRWYRYHHLFADLLRFKAGQELGPARQAGIGRRAAQWFEEQGLWHEAIQQAVAAGAHDVAGRVIGHQAAPTLVRGELGTLGDWLAALPAAEIDRQPRLKLAQAWVALFSGQSQAAETSLNQALDLIHDLGPEERPALSGEALAIRATLAMGRYDLVQLVADSEQALKFLPSELLALRSLVAWHLAFGYRAGGQIALAVQAYRQAISLSQQGGNVLVNFSARRELAELLLAQGDLASAQSLLQALVEEATTGGWRHLYPVSQAYIHLGEILYEWNRPAEAAFQIQAGLALPESTFMDFNAYGYALLGHVFAALGDLAAAQAAVEQAQQQALSAGHARRRALTLARIARFWLGRGEVVRAASWLPDGRDIPQEPAEEVYLQVQTTRARYLLAAGDRAAAQHLVDDLLAGVAGSGWLLAEVNLRLLQAQFLAGPEAACALEQALRLAELAGLVRTILDQGPAVTRLLGRLAAGGDVPAVYLSQLQAAAGEPGPAAGQALVEPLSQRELEVLRLVAAGYTNQEIAQQLVFTVATAKKHLENVYGKLGVRNRTEAVAKARALNLL